MASVSGFWKLRSIGCHPSGLFSSLGVMVLLTRRCQFSHLSFGSWWSCSATEKITGSYSRLQIFSSLVWVFFRFCLGTPTVSASVWGRLKVFDTDERWFYYTFDSWPVLDVSIGMGETCKPDVRGEVITGRALPSHEVLWLVSARHCIIFDESKALMQIEAMIVRRTWRPQYGTWGNSSRWLQ